MADDWTTTARQALLSLQRSDGGWGYRRNAAACAEPTALAGMALLASGVERSALQGASDLLGSLQRPDGSIKIAATIAEPGWMTPYAILFWKALGTCDDRVRRAADWLLAQQGQTLVRADDPKKIAGHDTSLVGWPWVDQTHSWLEPTALAVLALGRIGLADHPRVVQGRRLIVDRAVASGGWNYGNKAVFGHPLRAQPAPTGLALLALAMGGRTNRPEPVTPALRYLQTTLPEVRASASLGWGLIGLRAWGASPPRAETWLAESAAGVIGQKDAPARLACLLLAASEWTIEEFRNR